MPFELIHFRDADKILKSKKLEKDLQATLEYVSDCLYGTLHRGELLRQALEEMEWRRNDEALIILDGRRYRFKGFKKGIAIEGSFSAYEFILEGLIRLQIAYDKKKIDSGILLLTSARSEKTPYGSTKKMVEEDIQTLVPSISLPVSIALFDLGSPVIPQENGEPKAE
ncbi:MAG: hypothetical protein FJ123_00140 [Deltaproteobacteria bacterium]|nr:hypothetical protein [Deltaproteobacteria bacterium]